MRTASRWLAGTALAGVLIGPTAGCGGANSGLADQPEVKRNPPMSAMPGFDEKSGQMKTNQAR